MIKSYHFGVTFNGFLLIDWKLRIDLHIVEIDWVLRRQAIHC